MLLLDEPMAGMGPEESSRLVELLRALKGTVTVLLIEHHLDVIKTADYVIDLGPEGGHAGGEVVAAGTPERIAASHGSHTGRFLKQRLGQASRTV